MSVNVSPLVRLLAGSRRLGPVFGDRFRDRLRDRRGAQRGPTPTRAVLVEYVGRQSGAVVLIAGAAVVAYLAGHTGEVRPYLVMAAAVVPQVLLALVALGDEDRRHRLAASARPAWLLGAAAVVLALSGMVTWFAGEPPTTPVAAVIAAAGLAVAASPTSLAFVPRR